MKEDSYRRFLAKDDARRAICQAQFAFERKRNSPSPKRHRSDSPVRRRSGTRHSLITLRNSEQKNVMVSLPDNKHAVLAMHSERASAELKKKDITNGTALKPSARAGGSNSSTKHHLESQPLVESALSLDSGMRSLTTDDSSNTPMGTENEGVMLTQLKSQ
mmetsp:Transcript_33495/g.62263  ORF Transcript_33495/g.62263 Transcript_33495/m.62263 type:complete len:161 (+) Transcript_33495:789-1271(+)